MILFIGDKPSKSTDPDVPFKGAKCENRLKEWLSVLAKGHMYYLINRVDVDANDLVALTTALGYPVIALGNNASKYLKSIPHFKMPHPSGRNRQLNNKTFISSKIKSCKKYIERNQPCHSR